jgi:phospholipid/cholesterol/gamma-HCH transport system permease protein
MFRDIGQIVYLALQTAAALPLTWRQRRKVFDQLFEMGNASLLVACLVSLFIGGVITLQTGPTLVERGLASAVGGLVGLSMCKELGPVMMAILIAGRIGSAIAAEIGSMAVYQEIDALRTMNISPVRFLVLPRVVAISIALPTLCVFSIMVGWLGGAIVANYNTQISIGYDSFFGDLRRLVEVGDVVKGLIKAFVFAVVVGMIACHQGLKTVGGPRGIGRSVTKAVVNSIVLILILDYFVTRVLMEFKF